MRRVSSRAVLHYARSGCRDNDLLCCDGKDLHIPFKDPLRKALWKMAWTLTRHHEKDDREEHGGFMEEPYERG
jgi:hypothetical protein